MSRALAALLLLAPAAAARAADDIPDDFSFFQKEARVVTASRRPARASQAPATVYVVTSDDIRDSGAQTLWDALRTVPGVDVMAERTSQADVSIRGLNQALNNRTLVLLDGKTVLNGFLDFTDWEAIPVTLEEVDRIEVVEGPASALYGNNAVSGVINIITKKPEQLKGGLVQYTGGERNTQIGGAVVGDRRGAQAFKVGMGWRATDRFSDASRQASSVGKADAFYSLDLPHDVRWSVSGGVADHDVNINSGPSDDVGDTGYLRTDVKRRGTSSRFFWNWGRAQFRDHPVFPFHLHYDTLDYCLEQSLDLPFENALTAGWSYRRNAARSDVFAPGTRVQDLWALYFEDQWKPREDWTAVVSGRADHHPLTGWQLSPRGSVIYSPVPEHSFRVSAASAFRNPTLFEDYVDFSGDVPIPPGAFNPPFTDLHFIAQPNPGLRPENIESYEVAHRGSFDGVKTTLTGFYYRLRRQASSPNPAFTGTPPVLTETASVTNAGETKALGGELGAELQASARLSAFVNYSYQSLIDQLPSQTFARSAPRHKVNLGGRYKRAGWIVYLSGDWVDKTYWSDNSSPTAPVFARVAPYFLLDASARYRFSGRWEGLEAGVSGFNIADRHYETLPQRGPAAPGQMAEPIAARWSGTLSYRFGL